MEITKRNSITLLAFTAVASLWPWEGYAKSKAKLELPLHFVKPIKNTKLFAAEGSLNPALAPFPGWPIFNLGVPRQGDLAIVNKRVNARIVPTEAAASRPWRIIYGGESDLSGCCHDYAVTKRAELMGLGWPACRLLLCEVAYSATEDHMVLLVDGFSLDNLRADIVLFEKTGYRLVRQQTTVNPSLWEKPSSGTSARFPTVDELIQ